jgi:hypothetical protein
MHVIIHAGMPKTGSTSIQTALAAARPRLAEHGILYPQFGDHASLSHWQLAAFGYESTGDGRRMRRMLTLPHGWDVEVINRLESLLRQARENQQDILLSDEGMIHPERLSGLKRLRDLIESYGGEITVLAYARSPVDLFPSDLQQRLKNLPRARRINQSGWASPHSAGFERLEASFNRERTHLRLFDRRLLVQGDVVADFAAWIGRIRGAELPPLEAGLSSNESMSAAACAILMAALDQFPALTPRAATDLEERIYGRLRSLLVAFQAGRPAPKLEMPLGWRDMIQETNRDDWNRLVDRSSHEPHEKQVMMISQVASGSPTGPADIHAHLMSGFDSDFFSDFWRFCARAVGRHSKEVDEILSRIATAAHRPRTGEKTLH